MFWNRSVFYCVKFFFRFGLQLDRRKAFAVKNGEAFVAELAQKRGAFGEMKIKMIGMMGIAVDDDLAAQLKQKTEKMGRGIRIFPPTA